MSVSMIRPLYEPFGVTISVRCPIWLRAARSVVGCVVFIVFSLEGVCVPVLERVLLVSGCARVSVTGFGRCGDSFGTVVCDVGLYVG